MSARRVSAERLFGFAMFVASRRSPIHVREVARETGYSLSNTYRLLNHLQQHVAFDIRDGFVTVRRPVAAKELAHG
jgi:hypothetical protein